MGSIFIYHCVCVLNLVVYFIKVTIIQKQNRRNIFAKPLLSSVRLLGKKNEFLVLFSLIADNIFKRPKPKVVSEFFH